MWFAYFVYGISLGRNVVENKMLVMLVDPGGFPLRTLGHVEWTQWSFAEDPEREVER